MFYFWLLTADSLCCCLCLQFVPGGDVVASSPFYHQLFPMLILIAEVYLCTLCSWLLYMFICFCICILYLQVTWHFGKKLGFYWILPSQPAYYFCVCVCVWDKLTSKYRVEAKILSSHLHLFVEFWEARSLLLKPFSFSECFCVKSWFGSLDSGQLRLYTIMKAKDGDIHSFLPSFIHRINLWVLVVCQALEGPTRGMNK